MSQGEKPEFQVEELNDDELVDVSGGACCGGGCSDQCSQCTACDSGTGGTISQL